MNKAPEVRHELTMHSMKKVLSKRLFSLSVKMSLGSDK